MGWLSRVVNSIVGVNSTDWILIEDLPDPGLNISGNALVTDECYVELYVESLRLEKARKFATAFHGVVYANVTLAREGEANAVVASVTKPQWSEIPSLCEKYDRIKLAIGAGDKEDSKKALLAFNRELIVCPDLIPKDKERLAELVSSKVEQSFPTSAGVNIASRADSKLVDVQLSDLGLYEN